MRTPPPPPLPRITSPVAEAHSRRQKGGVASPAAGAELHPTPPTRNAAAAPQLHLQPRRTVAPVRRQEIHQTLMDPPRLAVVLMRSVRTRLHFPARKERATGPRPQTQTQPKNQSHQTQVLNTRLKTRRCLPLPERATIETHVSRRKHLSTPR